MQLLHSFKFLNLEKSIDLNRASVFCGGADDNDYHYHKFMFLKHKDFAK